MKFKIIFLVFNAIIIISFLFIFFMPFFILGWEYTQFFWSRNWILAVFFLLVMAVLNTYFALNWKLFSFLEKEDWQGLINYLEKKIYTDKRIRKQYIRILINTYLVRSETDKISTLEGFLSEKTPEMLPKFALQLGIPHLLKNDPEDMEKYFGKYLNDPKCKEKNWIRWNYVFALMLQQRTEESKQILLELNEAVKNPVLRLLTLYLMDAFTSQDEKVKQVVDEGKTQFKTKFSYKKWEAELEKQKGNLEVIVLSRLIKDATSWMYPTQSS